MVLGCWAAKPERPCDCDGAPYWLDGAEKLLACGGKYELRGAGGSAKATATKKVETIANYAKEGGKEEGELMSVALYEILTKFITFFSQFFFHTIDVAHVK